jgi:hypothetical protein
MSIQPHPAILSMPPAPSEPRELFLGFLSGFPMSLGAAEVLGRQGSLQAQQGPEGSDQVVSQLQGLNMV